MLSWIRDHFSTLQMGIGAAFVLIAWVFFRPKPPESNFRVRESDRLRKPAEAPLAIPGIRLEGAPHEVLGVSADASREEIQQAYRELMKRYHPDRVAPPGTQPWHDAQKIAEIINHAKDELIKRG